MPQPQKQTKLSRSLGQSQGETAVTRKTKLTGQAVRTGAKLNRGAAPGDYQTPTILDSPLLQLGLLRGMLEIQ